MQKSKIEWTGGTFNPKQGCTEVSPACDNCYAKNMAGWLHKDLDLWNGRHLDASEASWQEPVTLNRRAARTGIRERVFCGSTCDVMERHPDWEDGTRPRLWKLIEDTPYLDWILLTKRPQEYRKFLPSAWLQDPRSNVWIMATCEMQVPPKHDYTWRINEILKIPATVHGLSIEPMLSRVVLPDEFLKLEKSAWVIAGGEKTRSKNCRATPADWFRELRDQCVSAGVPFFFKQWGSYEDLVKIKKVGDEKHRTLDGRTWDEYPTPLF
jgi:protein gp37